MYRAIVKPILDTAIAFAALAALLPVLLVIAVCVYLDVGWPVLFVQERAGRHGSPFRVLKFRSMRSTLDAYGQPLPDPQRTTRFGKWLRSCSLDELPGLWNVLRGEMSLIGPRPLPASFVPCYDPEQRRRLLVRPGLTGWAAVNGRNSQPWERIFAHDCWYVDHLSLRMDALIFARSIVVVLSRRGIERGVHDRESPFAEKIAALRAQAS